MKTPLFLSRISTLEASLSYWLDHEVKLTKENLMGYRKEILKTPAFGLSYFKKLEIHLGAE